MEPRVGGTRVLVEEETEVGPEPERGEGRRVVIELACGAADASLRFFSYPNTRVTTEGGLGDGGQSSSQCKVRQKWCAV